MDGFFKALDLRRNQAIVVILFLPAHIYYSQEFRTYSFSFLLAILLTAALFHYLSDPSPKQRWALAVACAALFGAQYVSLFYIGSVLFIGGVWISIKSTRRHLQVLLISVILSWRSILLI